MQLARLQLLLRVNAVGGLDQWLLRVHENVNLDSVWAFYDSSLFAELNVVAGMAFGGGSAIAQRAVEALMGPRTIRYETVVSDAPAPTAGSMGGSDVCSVHSKAFQDVCLPLYTFIFHQTLCTYISRWNPLSFFVWDLASIFLFGFGIHVERHHEPLLF